MASITSRFSCLVNTLRLFLPMAERWYLAEGRRYILSTKADFIILGIYTRTYATGTFLL
mgnify:CR=1 FL=1